MRDVGQLLYDTDGAGEDQAVLAYIAVALERCKTLTALRVTTRAWSNKAQPSLAGMHKRIVDMQRIEALSVGCSFFEVEAGGKLGRAAEPLPSPDLQRVLGQWALSELGRGCKSSCSKVQEVGWTWYVHTTRILRHSKLPYGSGDVTPFCDNSPFNDNLVW